MDENVFFFSMKKVFFCFSLFFDEHMFFFFCRFFMKTPFFYCVFLLSISVLVDLNVF